MDGQADGVESAADLEVDRIMTEITAGVLAPAAAAPSTAVKGPATATTAAGAVGKMPAAAEEQQVGSYVHIIFLLTPLSTYYDMHSGIFLNMHHIYRCSLI